MWALLKGIHADLETGLKNNKKLLSFELHNSYLKENNIVTSRLLILE